MPKESGLRIRSCFLAVLLLGANSNLAKAAEVRSGRIVRPNVSPVVTTLNRATINGTGVTRPGAGPSRLGGPAKAVARINGTSIRRKN